MPFEIRTMHLIALCAAFHAPALMYLYTRVQLMRHKNGHIFLPEYMTILWMT